MIEKLGQCFASFRTFDFSLSTIRRLPGGVLYLAPQPDEPFRRLTLAVWDCFPETPPYGGRYSRVVPHLTLAQLANEQQADQVAADFAQPLGGNCLSARPKRNRADRYADGELATARDPVGLVCGGGSKSHAAW